MLSPVHVSRWKMSPVCDNHITVIINIWWTGNICQQLPGYNDFSTGNIIQMWSGFVIGWHCYKTFHILRGEKLGMGGGGDKDMSQLNLSNKTHLPHYLHV